MKEENFIFSLYPNDLIRVTGKKPLKLSKVNKDSTLSDTKEINEVLLYYKGTDIATASISAIIDDNSYFIKSLGVKTLKSMEKHTVDVLGEYHRVGKEKRMGFNIKRS